MDYIFDHLGSVYFYFLLLVFSTLFAFLSQMARSKRVGNFFVSLVVLTLALPAGLRADNVGIDTSAYIQIIKSANLNYMSSIAYTNYEIGFRWLIEVSLFLFKDPHYVLLVIAFLTNILIVRTLWFFKDKISFSLSVFVYSCMFYFETYNIARQWLAIAIVFFAVRFLLDKKYFKYFIFVVLGSLIHSSAIICLIFIPIHMLISKRIPLKYKILLIISIVAFAFFNNYITDVLGIVLDIDKYQIYLQSNQQTTGIGFLFIVRAMVLLTAIWLLITKKYKFDDINFAKTTIALYSVGVFLILMGYISVYATRMSYYGIVFEFIIFSMISNSKPYSIFIKTAVVLLSFYLFYIGLSSGSTQGHVPYKLFFTE